MYRKTVLVAALSIVVAAISAFTANVTPSAAVVIYGSLGRLPSTSARVLAQAQFKTGTGLRLVTVAHGSFGGDSFRLPVPESPALRRAEKLGRGVVNFNVIVIAGAGITSQFTPAVLSASAEPGNVQALAEFRSHKVLLPRFPAFRHLTPSQARIFSGPNIPVGCDYFKDGPEKETLTRIGEAHVNASNGLTMRFNYHTQDDATITVGVGDSGEHWSTSGSITLTDSFDTNGGFTFDPATLIYVDSQFYYQEYKADLSGTCPPSEQYVLEGDHTAGSANPGTNSPSANPYGGCIGDPHGKVTMDSGGDWSSDTARAARYSGIASLFGFTFGGGTGYSSDILEHYYNKSDQTQYLCGTNVMPNVPIIYSDQF